MLHALTRRASDLELAQRLYLRTLKRTSPTAAKHDIFVTRGAEAKAGVKKPEGILHAALQSEHPHLLIVPTAVSYDLVLEDYVLARQKVKRGQRAFSREVAEMVRYAVGYRSRAFVTFGKAIDVEGVDANSRRAVLDLARRTLVARVSQSAQAAVSAARS